VSRAINHARQSLVCISLKRLPLYQVEKLGKSPVIGELVDGKQLKVVGAYYDLDSGKVSLI